MELQLHSYMYLYALHWDTFTSTLVGCVKLSTILHAVPNLGISGATTPFLHVPLCLALGHLYLYFSGVCEAVYYPSRSTKFGN